MKHDIRHKEDPTYLSMSKKSAIIVHYYRRHTVSKDRHAIADDAEFGRVRITQEDGRRDPRQLVIPSHSHASRIDHARELGLSNEMNSEDLHRALSSVNYTSSTIPCTRPRRLIRFAIHLTST